MYDLIIHNGQIYDGTGAPPQQGDIAVQGSKIQCVGEVSGPARRVIDARGRAVTPGFIDIHRHADCAVFRPDFGKLELKQGLTTIINGNCGLSAAPIGGPYEKEILDYLDPITGIATPEMPLHSLKAYLDAAEARGLPIHIGMLAGAGTIRAAVAGYSTEVLSEEQYDEIGRQLLEALREGALGVSLGLGYAPECFYSTEGLIRALRPLAGRDIPITVHMREEGGAMLEALEEMIQVAHALRVPVHISHLKAIGRKNWQKLVPQALRRMEEERAAGWDITCDGYPYTAGSTQLIHILPHDFLTGGTHEIKRRLADPVQRELLTKRIKTGEDFDNIAGAVGWENIRCATLEQPENQKYQGMSIAEIAADMGKDPFSCAYDLLISEDCKITMIDFVADEADIATILRDPWANVISDSTYPTEGGKFHPRVYGTFARILDTYVRREKVLPLEAAVAKMTSIPARVMRLTGKGRIAPGMDADLCIFDPATVREVGTYEDPERYAKGMDYVIVAGRCAIDRGQFGFMENGSVLRGKQ